MATRSVGTDEEESKSLPTDQSAQEGLPPVSWKIDKKQHLRYQPKKILLIKIVFKILQHLHQMYANTVGQTSPNVLFRPG